ncbi:MAG: bifunctional metallophosphatase/5'-nucleotidase [Bacteroidales bacterium]
MNQTLRRVALATLLSLAVLGCPAVAFGQAGAASVQAVPLTILHTNDTHSHLLPFSYPDGPVEAGAETTTLEERTDIGGIARRATLVRRLRAQLAARHSDVWLVDAGDFSDGTPFSIEYKGTADIEAMNAVGYDFGTLGNHEFNIRLEDTRKLISMARFPLLCANAVDNASGKLLVQESVVQNVGPVRVGVFGLLTRQASTYPAAKEGVTIADEVETARRVVASLRQRADIVVLISHAGERVDNQLRREVPGIDVIVGGHSHSRLNREHPKWRPEELHPANGTVIVQAHQWGGELGRVDLLFVKDQAGWHVDRYNAGLIYVDKKYKADPKVAAVVDRFWQPIAPKYGVVVGKAGDDFTKRGPDDAHYNLFADAVRETFGTDIDLENTGSIRAPIAKGKITSGDLVMMDPFNNTVVTLKLTGRDLKQVLAQTGAYVSGVRYQSEKKQLVAATIGGRPIEDERLYTVSTNSYFAGYAFLKVHPQDVVDTKRSRLEVVSDYIKKKGTVKPVYDGRRVVPRQDRPSDT